MYDILALGELLIDFTYYGESADNKRLFEQNPGGAPANVLCAAANLGLSTAIIGKVGNDMHGDYLRSVLYNKGVDTEGLISADDVFTTLAFVELNESGERRFSFARKPGADTCLTWDEVNKDLLASCRIFHFGSLSLTDEPSRSATLEAVKAAKNGGAIISYDPNYREPLWRSEDEAVEMILSVLPMVDILKISSEEAKLIFKTDILHKAADMALSEGVSCAVITLGGDGAYAAVNGAFVRIPALNVPVVDTTGAGDAFCGGFLYKLIKSGLKPNQLREKELEEFTEFAIRVASHCVQRRGAIPAMPTVNDII
jgi:fructokinase